MSERIYSTSEESYVDLPDRVVSNRQYQEQVQTAFISLLDKIEAVEAGEVAEGSISNTELDDDIKIGSLADLDTTEKDSIVGAINELVAMIGDLTTLETTEKGSVVGAINEIVV